MLLPSAGRDCKHDISQTIRRLTASGMLTQENALVVKPLDFQLDVQRTNEL